MASNFITDSLGDYQEDYSDSSEENSDDDDGSSTGASFPSASAHSQDDACRYYNRGHCKYGSQCRFLHLCQYALRGACRRGADCRLAHPGPGAPPGGRKLRRQNSAFRDIDMTLDDGRPYQWQLQAGRDWLDLANDHILEAQYSLPNTSGIRIYGTPYGVVSIDFQKMRVRGQDMRVRRLDGGSTEWAWFYSCRSGWAQYGKKDAEGKPSPVQCSEIEQKYQNDRKSSCTFNINTDVYEIKFKVMRQVSAARSRKVRRRPVYQPKTPQGPPPGVAAARPVGVAPAASQSPEWSFQGSGGRWHVFKKGSGSSVASADIEAEFQSDPHGSMRFTVNGQPYHLDFSAMKQTNLSTQMTRTIRRL